MTEFTIQTECEYHWRIADNAPGDGSSTRSCHHDCVLPADHDGPHACDCGAVRP
jgi:hypothetical protein